MAREFRLLDDRAHDRRVRETQSHGAPAELNPSPLGGSGKLPVFHNARPPIEPRVTPRRRVSETPSRPICYRTLTFAIGAPHRNRKTRKHFGAPGRTRTCATGSGGRCSI